MLIFYTKPLSNWIGHLDFWIWCLGAQVPNLVLARANPLRGGKCLRKILSQPLLSKFRIEKFEVVMSATQLAPPGRGMAGQRRNKILVREMI
jgi:hypothetical protein